jgi:hypothetical protein
MHLAIATALSLSGCSASSKSHSGGSEGESSGATVTASAGASQSDSADSSGGFVCPDSRYCMEMGVAIGIIASCGPGETCCVDDGACCEPGTLMYQEAGLRCFLEAMRDDRNTILLAIAEELTVYPDGTSESRSDVTDVVRLTGGRMAELSRTSVPVDVGVEKTATFAVRDAKFFDDCLAALDAGDICAVIPCVYDWQEPGTCNSETQCQTGEPDGSLCD